MAAVTGLTVVKRFTYRGDATEEFSNTYHFKSPPPGDAASWGVLVDDVLAIEAKVLSTDTFFVRVYGYDSDDPNAAHVYAHDYTVPGPPPAGTFPTAAGTRMAGDQAALVEWLTDARTIKGKPIYLRKYLHGGYIASTLQVGDELEPSYETALNTYGTEMRAIYGGLRGRVRDLNVQSVVVIPWVTTRTLKRRGKRPKTGP